MMVQPKKTRARILNAIQSADGNARRAAEQLGCSYHTLWRLINDDGDLQRQVKTLRQKLADEGIGQRGWERPG